MVEPAEPSEEEVGVPDDCALLEELAAFANEHNIKSKGALCLPLVVTDHARVMGLPLDPDRLRTEKEGQVLGLGKGKVQHILGRHGVDRVLAEEGGRTSRGSLGKMSAYVALLNRLYSESGNSLNVDQIEAFWIARVRDFFAAKPLVLRLDATASIRTTFRQLFEQAEARQKEMQGTMVVGAVLQHLVGAGLEGVYREVEHNCASTKDEGQARPGDFSIGDLAIHVSTAPGEALIRKCEKNLAGGQRPVIMTLGRGVALATGLSENSGLAGRIDVFDVNQWLAAGVINAGGESVTGRTQAISLRLERYNRIIESVETDPSLRIELATGQM